MSGFIKFLTETRKKEKKIVFIETDKKAEFPHDTLVSLKKEINKNCKDLEQDWKSAVEVVNAAFNELDVPIPQAYQKERWPQYVELLGYAVKNLIDSRGSKGSWASTI